MKTFFLMPLSVLKIAAFRNLWVAQLLSQMTFNMLTFVLGIFIYEQTRSNTAVSILYLAIGLPAFIFGIVSGIYVDRVNKKQILISTTLLRAFFIVLLFFSRGNLIAVYGLTIVISSLGQFFVPAEASLIPTFVAPGQLMTANSFFTMTFYSAIIGGYVMGGPLLSWVGSNSILLLLSALFIIAVLFVSFVPNSKPVNTLKKGQAWKQIKADIYSCVYFVKNNVRIGQAIVLLTLSQAIIAIFATLGPGFADTILHVKLTDASVVILGPAALGMIVGALFTASFGNKFKKITLIQSGFYLSGLLLLAVSLLIGAKPLVVVYDFIYFLTGREISFSILLLSIGCFFWLGFANSLIDVACNTVLQEKTGDSMRGKIYGLLASLIGGVAIIPVVISAIIADYFGIEKIMISLGILLLIVGFIVNKKQKQVIIEV